MIKYRKTNPVKIDVRRYGRSAYGCNLNTTRRPVRRSVRDTVVDRPRPVRRRSRDMMLQSAWLDQYVFGRQQQMGSSVCGRFWNLKRRGKKAHGKILLWICFDVTIHQNMVDQTDVETYFTSNVRIRPVACPAVIQTENLKLKKHYRTFRKYIHILSRFVYEIKVFRIKYNRSFSLARSLSTRLLRENDFVLSRGSYFFFFDWRLNGETQTTLLVVVTTVDRFFRPITQPNS